LHSDKNGAGLFLLADTRIPIPDPADPRRAGSLPLMSVQCEKGKPEFFVNLNFEFELPGGRLPVRYRLDGGEANDAVWRSNNEGGGVAIEPDEPVGFVRVLLGKRALELSFTLGGKPATARFDITGLGKALTLLTPHCRW
jgi:hypothetical protein